MSWRDAGFFLRARLSRVLTRWGNRHSPELAPPAPLDDVLRGARTPLALTRLLEGRSNADREAALLRWLQARNFPIARHRFETFEKLRAWSQRSRAASRSALLRPSSRRVSASG